MQIVSLRLLMLDLTDEEMKGKILDKLARWKKFGASYTDKRDAVKGLPPHLTGKGLKLVDEMIKDRLLLTWKVGKCVSVNLKMRNEVERLIKLFSEKKYASKIK